MTGGTGDVVDAVVDSSYDFAYVQPVNENLLCPICCLPFIDAVTAEPCGHTFCRRCLETSVREDVQAIARCPVDRGKLTVDAVIVVDGNTRDGVDGDVHVMAAAEADSSSTADEQLGGRVTLNFRPAPLAIRNMVEELPVYCDVSTSSATVTAASSGTLTSPANDIANFHCTAIVQRQNLAHHRRDECPVVIVECPNAVHGCEVQAERWRIKEHLTARCPKERANCDHVRFGCAWEGAWEERISHLSDQCAYEPVKAFLIRQAALNERLERENRELRDKVAALSQRNDDGTSASAAALAPSTSASDVMRLQLDHQRLHTELDMLRHTQAAMEMRQNMALSTEVLRMQEEMHGVREMVQRLHLQMRRMMMASHGGAESGGPPLNGGSAARALQASTNTTGNNIITQTNKL